MGIFPNTHVFGGTPMTTVETPKGDHFNFPPLALGRRLDINWGGGLEELILGHNFNQRLNINSLPDSLKVLKFLGGFLLWNRFYLWLISRVSQ